MTRSGLSLEELRIVEGQGQSSEVITPSEEMNRINEMGECESKGQLANPEVCTMPLSPNEKNCLRMRTDAVVFWYVAFDLHSEMQWPESFPGFIKWLFTGPIESYIKAVKADVQSETV